MIKAKVCGVCISTDKGTGKKDIKESNLIENWGLENDAHAGHWHRQISLLAKEKIDDFNNHGAGVEYGAFGENIIVEGCDLNKLPIGTIIEIGNTSVLRVTQIGKKCHSGCDVMKRMGHCIMPTNGIFVRVLKGGSIKTGDEIRIYNGHRVSIITLSDKASRGERIDTSSLKIEEIVKEKGYEISEKCILPDEKNLIEEKLIDICDSRKAELILTTGGTGLSERDVTPEATKAVIEKEVPGISELMRALTMKYTNRAMLSRGVSGIRRNTLIINLSGSPVAVEEQLCSIIDSLEHGIDTLCGLARECARQKELEKKDK